MPEGDTIARAARALHRALAGEAIKRFESVFPHLNRVRDDRPLAGRTVERVHAAGKHLLMDFTGDLTLRTHMRMHGSWHLYRPGERWRLRPGRMRILVATGRAEAVAFDVHDAEMIRTSALAASLRLRSLGPDLAGPVFDREEALRRVRGARHGTLAELLLDQRVMAGAGNVLKSEVLFLSGLDPFRLAASLTERERQTLVDQARRALAVNLLEGPGPVSRSVAAGRRTTDSDDPSARLFVYRRAGRPCRRCGAAIRSRRHGAHARVTYWCPRCQA